MFDGPLDGEVVPGRRRRGKKSKQNNCGGWCPLICAIASGHVEVATTLLRDHGASVNCHTTKDFVSLGFPKALAPIYLAAQCAVDPKAMVELCIEYGADINASSADLGLTPAHVSIIMRNMTGLKVCIEQSGFNVNQAATFNGATPLSYGAFFGDEEVCQLLLDAGATKTCMVSKWRPLKDSCDNIISFTRTPRARTHAHTLTCLHAHTPQEPPWRFAVERRGQQPWRQCKYVETHLRRR